MTCHQVQTDLSLYLYGELDFATEEELEQHLESCALCQNALAREKSWHTAINAEQSDAPLDLLSECRRDLKRAMSGLDARTSARGRFWNWGESLRLSLSRFSVTRWSMGMAIGSFLVFVGFSAGRLADRSGIPGLWSDAGIEHAGFITPGTARIRDIQSDDPQHVRIIVDRVREQEITGRADDQEIRQWLLAAMRDPSDPGIRVDSVEVLQNQTGADVRDALLYSVRHDPNAAVRLKALEGLRRFTDDSATREALRYVLQHDTDAGVRSEAIDVLAPAGQNVAPSPDLAATLQQIVRSQAGDDYIRMRCVQILSKMNAPVDVY